MAYDTWGGSWGTSWGLSWTRSGVIPPVVIPDTGGSGNRSRGAGRRVKHRSNIPVGAVRRRNINDDPDRFEELLKEWRARKQPQESPAPGTAQGDESEGVRLETHRSDTLVSSPDELFEQIKRIEAAYDRSMAAYETALAKVEQANVAKALKAALAQEELAQQKALQLAIEWELALLAYAEFLEEEDIAMLLLAV